jgi:hypothetical protein
MSHTRVTCNFGLCDLELGCPELAYESLCPIEHQHGMAAIDKPQNVIWICALKINVSGRAEYPAGRTAY